MMFTLMLALFFQAAGGGMSNPPKEEAVRLAKDALSEKLNVSEATIGVEQVRPVDWPDASLGCPAEGETHAKVVTPGYQVLLSADRNRYPVHVGDGRAVVCDYSKMLTQSKKHEPKILTPPPPRGSPISLSDHPELEEMVDDAKQDLADRLSIDQDRIAVKELTEVVWPDGSLGCPKPGMAYIQVPHDGLRIRLSVDDRIYDYHSGKGLPPFLCDPGR